MASKIIDGVYQLKVPIPNNPLENTNVYLLRGNNSYALIDCGWGGEIAFTSLSQQLAQLEVGFRDISQIIVTHAHFDHFGLAGRIKQLSNATIYMHRQEGEIFRTRYTITEEFIKKSEEWFKINGVPDLVPAAMRMPVSGFSRPVLPQPDILLDGGETIVIGCFNLQIFWTPGHSPGHICLYEPDRKLLFAGDHVLPVITPNVSLPPQSDDNPLGDFLKSLSTIKTLTVDTVLPAHETIFNNLSKRVNEIVQHHENRSEEILKALNYNQMTAYEISNLITWMPELGGVKFADLMPFDKRNAVSETLAHLRAMSIAQKVTSVTQGSIVYYKNI